MGKGRSSHPARRVQGYNTKNNFPIAQAVEDNFGREKSLSVDFLGSGSRPCENIKREGEMGSCDYGHMRS